MSSCVKSVVRYAPPQIFAIPLLLQLLLCYLFQPPPSHIVVVVPVQKGPKVTSLPFGRRSCLWRQVWIKNAGTRSRDSVEAKKNPHGTAVFLFAAETNGEALKTFKIPLKDIANRVHRQENPLMTIGKWNHLISDQLIRNGYILLIKLRKL